MMNNNKILTVSYGTFSCTLEGFDDSFDTMKAIAEYFRDLAADDRYFGAEPPQPDAEMLARIAEREVARRVEASEHEGRILLKAHDAAPSAPDIAPATVAATAAAAAAAPEAQAEEPADDMYHDAPQATPVEPEAEQADDTSMADAPETDSPDAPMHNAAAAPEEFLDDTADENVAEPEELEAEDAAVAEEVTEDVAEPEAETTEQEDAAETDDQPLAADAAEDSTAQEDFAAELLDQDDAIEAEAFFADSPAPGYSDVEMDAEIDTPSDFATFEQPAAFVAPEAASSAAADSIAAKLQRIREVVSQQDDETYDEEDTAATGEPVDILDMPFEMAVQPDATLEETGEGAEFEEDEALEAADAARHEAAQEIEEAFEVDDQIAADAEEAQEDEDDLSAMLSRLENGEADGEDSLLGAEDEEITSEDAEDNLFGEEDTSDENIAATDAADADADDKETLRTSEVKGRVLKVDRADLEAALEAGDLEEFDGEDSAILSEEEEAELQRELDAVAAENEAAGAEKPAARDNLPAIDADAAEDVTRLMAEADQQMEEPEGATRRSAFAHLRAAVAARFADKSMAKEDAEEETIKAYRSDLAQVVKPRRPVPSGARTERPADQRPTPLKLVAEQRIDDGAATDTGPVMPRRVAATLEDDLEFAEDTGFAEFAEQMGATKLPEVLEAAAAYLAFVEGHEQFSRPQLMTRVRQADCGEFSREDGLRSFGQLLRAGKIEKIKGGRFAASDAIGFKPDERAAS